MPRTSSDDRSAKPSRSNRSEDVADENAYRIPNEPMHFVVYDRTSYISDLLDTFKQVHTQLTHAGPNEYKGLIILLGSYAEARDADPDDLDGAARAVLHGTRHVSGGAIEKLRILMGA
jgi:hypothetical protein